MSSLHRRGVTTFLIFLLITLVVACGDPAVPPTEQGSPSSIVGYNYTIEGIQEFSVNGAWGGNMSVGAGGGSRVCCVVLPKKWSPGLLATVKWKRSDCRNDEKRCPDRAEDVKNWPMLYLTKEVPIEAYDRPYSTYVIFLPGDEVKISVMPYGPDHPDHPMHLGRARPLDHPEWRRYQP